jgi:predicted Ser/Thr protein kinase
MIGTVIDNEYEVLEQIGEGGLGVVYRCQDRQLGRDVALKMLRNANPDETELKRFMAEGRALAALNHPNVVHIYRLDKHESMPYFAMEYLDGQTLRSTLDHGRLPLRQGLEIMRQVAEGMQAIQAKGIVHRDLSTKNIMICSSGTVKILDLGLSKNMQHLSTVTREGVLAGTVLYMCPEQIEGDPVTFASDVFTFGITLYEVVTGSHPFAAEHHMATMYNIVNRPYEPISSVVDSAPQELERLVERCLAKRPAERLQEFGTIATSLAAIIKAVEAEPEYQGATQETTTTPRAARAPGRARIKNPYLNRVMIKRPEEFFGREREVRRIYARLNATPPGSVSIVGDRKIGKSSLLNYVYMRQNRQRWLDDPASMVVVFLDLQQEKGMMLEKFVDLMLGVADYELRERIQLADCSRDLDGVRRMVERLNDSGYRLTVILDEFEAITQNNNFSLEFFSFLRFLANHYNVAYLTSSARDLQDLCHTKEVSDSPFFNIFSTMRLGALTESEAIELIAKPSSEVGCPLEPYSKEIIDMAGRFPFFIQVACSHAIEYLEDTGKLEPQDLAEVRQRFYEEAKLHFRFIWDRTSSEERSAMRRIAEHRAIPPAYRHIIDGLERRDLVVRQDSEAKLFASTFQTFVGTEGVESPKGFLSRLLGRS